MERADRATFLLEKLTDRARDNGVEIPLRRTTDYINTSPPTSNCLTLAIALWSAASKAWPLECMAMVSHQNKYDDGIGGHIATYASLATLLEVGFNHFFHGSYGDQPGDLIYFQGHASPGIYARAFLEGRLSEDHLNNFRHELRATPGSPPIPIPG